MVVLNQCESAKMFLCAPVSALGGVERNGPPLPKTNNTAVGTVSVTTPARDGRNSGHVWPQANTLGSAETARAVPSGILQHRRDALRRGGFKQKVNSCSVTVEVRILVGYVYMCEIMKSSQHQPMEYGPHGETAVSG